MWRYLIYLLLLAIAVRTSLQQTHAAENPLSATFEHSAYTDFEHISVGVEAPFIQGIYQDHSGLMWICTHKGIYSYDGYRSTPHPYSEIPIQTHCATQIGNQIWIGSDHGVQIYDLPSGQYVDNETISTSGIHFVRTLLHSDGSVWIGHSQGLLRYDIPTNRLVRIYLKGSQNRTLGVYCLHEDETGLYVGTYDGLYRKDRTSAEFVRMGVAPASDIPSQEVLFVYTICQDRLHECLWLGTQDGLWRYTPSDNRLQREQELPNTVINSITLDRNGSIVIGSDAGLFIYDGSTLQHITHDARNVRSLADDDIESLLTDRDGNIWIGTHDGISLVRPQQAWEIVPLHFFTQSGRGLFPSSMLKDRSGGLWLGGTNGIIHIRPDGSVEEHHIHSSRHPLPHNSIHAFYEDAQGEIWAATDGGIICYDHTSRRFLSYPIHTGLYNAQWCYALTETHKGEFWIGTFSSGIFIYDRAAFRSHRGGVPDAHLRSEINNGQVFRMQTDPLGRVWVLYYDLGLDCISPEGEVSHFDLSRYIGTKIIPTDMILDDEGYLWAGFRGGVLRINTRTEETRRINFPDRYNGETLTIGTLPDAVWISTTDGLVWSIDRQTLQFKLIYRR